MLRSRILKQKQERIIAKSRDKIIDLEMESLKNNIAEKNRKLSAKALYLSGRNELIEEMVNSLSEIPEINKSKEINECISTLKSYIKGDNEWDDFISYFEQVNPVFIRTLTEKGTTLSKLRVVPFSGIAGNRTRVQTGKQRAFYTFSFRLSFRCRARPETATRHLAPKVSRTPRSERFSRSIFTVPL